MDFKAITMNITNFRDGKYKRKSLPTYWGCALAGEVGELCNMLKKMERDGRVFDSKDLGRELADIFIYIELLARRLNVDLESAIIDKIKEVESRHGITNQD